MRGSKPTGRDPGGEQRIEAELDRLTKILQKVAPVTSVSRSLFGNAPGFIGVSYCWRFKEADSGLYSGIEQMVRAFRGAMAWSFNFQFNQGGACIAGLVVDDNFYSPGGDVIPSSPAGRVNVPAGVSVADEVKKLCDFMDSAFTDAHSRRRSPAGDASISDGLAVGAIFDVMLVRDVRKFRWPTPTSVVDRHLDFGLLYDEWYALYFEVLGKSEGLTVRRPVDFQGEIAGYPLLSRLNDIHDGARFEASEVSALAIECLELQAPARNNPGARRCLEKLSLICRWAKDLNTGIWFSGQ